MWEHNPSIDYTDDADWSDSKFHTSPLNPLKDLFCNLWIADTDNETLPDM